MTIHLSSFEQQAAQGIVDGLTLEYIAYKMGIKIGVLRLYTQSLREKMQTNSTAAAVARCVDMGLIKPTYEIDVIEIRTSML